MTYDLLHDPSEDLLDSKQQHHIESMLDADCFLTVSAGPVCASFSRAVRPAVRSADAPRGLPNLTPSMSIKVALGNAMSQWVASLVLRAEKKGVPFWVENPSGSYMWKQPEWIPIVARFPGFLTDYCRWGTVWRKRTRFAGSFCANGKRLLCQCGKPHVKLVGYNKEYKMSWTKLAEGYPQRLAAYLAKEMAESLKPIARRRSLDPAACARAGHRRIGEAGNPGPRPARARPEVDLDDVALVQASTLAIQARAQRMFLDWLQAELTPETWESIRNSPELQLVFLRAFGSWAYQEGHPMYLFRHLIVFCQQQFPGARHHVTPAWELLARWELVQPTRHRPPLPKILLDAFVGLALTWGWARWAATTMLAFHGACRVGEPLKALRQDLILPDEAGLEIEVCFLNITAPKTSRRGRGRTQHTKITDESTVRLAKAVFSHFGPTRAVVPIVSIFLSEEVGSLAGSVRSSPCCSHHTRLYTRGRCSVSLSCWSTDIQHSMDNENKAPANSRALPARDSGVGGDSEATCSVPGTRAKLCQDGPSYLAPVAFLTAAQ